jgi:hypothetical protein
MDQSDERLVAIFKTDDPGVLPLAKMALEAEGIDYSVHSEGKADTMQWAMSQEPTIRPVVMEILVSSDVAARARDLVADLERPIAAIAPTDPSAIVDTLEPPGVWLEDAVTDRLLGQISEAQLQELTSHLEEDAPAQYFVDAETVEGLEAAHADAELVALLRNAVGDGPGLVIRWSVR